MERLEDTPRWFAARLADDTANFLRVSPGPSELADYYDSLHTMLDAVEMSMQAVRHAAVALVNAAAVR